MIIIMQEVMFMIKQRTLIDITNYDIKVIKVVSIFSNEKDYLFRGIKVKIFRVFDFTLFYFPWNF